MNDLLYQLYLGSSKYATGWMDGFSLVAVGVGLGDRESRTSSLKMRHVNLVVTGMLGLGVVISASFFWALFEST